MLNLTRLMITLAFTQNLHTDDITIPPSDLIMSIAIIADEPNFPLRHAIIIDGSLVFLTTDGFLRYVKQLTPNSKITWAPSDDRISPRPFIDSEEELNLLKNTCLDNKVDLIIIPGG